MWEPIANSRGKFGVGDAHTLTPLASRLGGLSFQDDP